MSAQNQTIASAKYCVREFKHAPTHKPPTHGIRLPDEQKPFVILTHKHTQSAHRCRQHSARSTSRKIPCFRRSTLQASSQSQRICRLEKPKRRISEFTHCLMMGILKHIIISTLEKRVCYLAFGCLCVFTDDCRWGGGQTDVFRLQARHSSRSAHYTQIPNILEQQQQ